MTTANAHHHQHQDEWGVRAGQGFEMRTLVIFFSSYLFLLDLQLFTDRTTGMSNTPTTIFDECEHAATTTLLAPHNNTSYDDGHLARKFQIFLMRRFQHN